MHTWHEDDQFWELFAPMMFDDEHWSVVPFQIDQVIARLDLREGAQILDMCCGPGRHSLELARRGYKVTAVDRTTSYLDRARKQADSEGLEIEFILEDMRDFRRQAVFDAAINLYTSFGYFEDPVQNLKVLSNLYASLKEGGRLIMDTMGKEVLARIFITRDWREQDGKFFLQEHNVVKDWRWVENRWIVIDDDGPHEFKISHWVYSAAELMEMLKKVGFREVQIFGNLEGASYDQAARRLVAVARK